MFGCHNCSQKPEKGTPFENSPCSRCRTMHDPVPRSRFDPVTEEPMTVMHPAYDEPDYATMEREILEKVFCALGRTVSVLLSIKERYPDTFDILEAKMQQPSLSYSQLAERFHCRKQNIFYHLKKAVGICPELQSAIIIDSRHSLGCSVMSTRSRK